MRDLNEIEMAPEFIGPLKDCEAILRVIDKDVQAFLVKDMAALASCYIHEDRLVSLMQIAGTGLIRCWGWDEFESMIARGWAVDDAPSVSDIRRERVRIKVSGDMAWVSFDQFVVGPEDATDPPGFSYNVRVFERHGTDWKIAFHGVFEPASAARGAPAVEVDESAAVISMNAAAAERLPDFAGLTVSHGRLRAMRPDWDKVLRDAISRASALSNYARLHAELGRGQHVSFPVVLGETETGGSLICRVEVNDFSVWTTFGDDEDLDRRLSVARAVYGLSDGQVNMARAIANGADLAQAAEELGVTVNTARTHLRRMFDKVGVRSQPALLRVILSLG